MEVVAELAAGSSERGHDVLIGYGIRPETPTDVRERIDDDVDVRALPLDPANSGATCACRPRDQEPRGRVGAGRGAPALVLRRRGWVAGHRRRDSNRASRRAFASGLPGIGSLRRSAYRTAERMTCRRVTEVGAVSLSEAKLALKLGARRVTRVANGVRELNSDRVRTRTLHELTSLPPRVVALGRTVPQRQPVACARILTKLREVAEVEWLGGGGGSRGRDGYDALAAADIPPSGWLSRGELLDRVGTATAYLHWTAWDGLPAFGPRGDGARRGGGGVRHTAEQGDPRTGGCLLHRGRGRRAAPTSGHRPGLRGAAARPAAGATQQVRAPRTWSRDGTSCMAGCSPESRSWWRSRRRRIRSPGGSGRSAGKRIRKGSRVSRPTGG